MFRIPSRSSRINELESDNECLRRIQYELLTTNSVLTGNNKDLQVEVEHFRNETELNVGRVLQMQDERDMALEQVESLQAENTNLLDDNARLHNALREAKEKLALQESAVIQPAPVEEPKWEPSMDEAVKMRAASIKSLSEEEILVRLTKRDDVIRHNLSRMDIQRDRAEQALTEVAQSFKRIRKVLDGDPYA